MEPTRKYKWSLINNIRCNILWSDETGQNFVADIDFDKAEIFEAYKQIHRDYKEQNAELVFKYNDTRTSIEIYLRSKSKEIENRENESENL